MSAAERFASSEGRGVCSSIRTRLSSGMSSGCWSAPQHQHMQQLAVSCACGPIRRFGGLRAPALDVTSSCGFDAVRLSHGFATKTLCSRTYPKLSFEAREPSAAAKAADMREPKPRNRSQGLDTWGRLKHRQNTVLQDISEAELEHAAPILPCVGPLFHIDQFPKGVASSHACRNAAAAVV